MRVSAHSVRVDGRIWHYRRCGDGPATLALHGAGESSRALSALLERLGRDGCAIAPDLPGHGVSDPPPAPLDAEGYAELLRAFMDALAIERARLFGSGLGALVALHLAARTPQRVSTLALERLPLGGDPGRCAPPAALEPELDGSHLLRHWFYLESRHQFAVWNRRERATRLAADTPPPAVLHRELLDNVRAREQLAAAHAAADCGRHAGALLAGGVPTAILVGLGDAFATAPESVPAGIEVVIAETAGELIERAAAFLGAEAGAEPSGPSHPAAAAGRFTTTYASTPWGQLFARYRTDAPGRPLVLIHPSPSSGSAFDELAESLAPHRPLYIFDTLGNGESDKLAAADAQSFARQGIGAWAGVLESALDDLGVGEVDVLGSKTGSVIGIELAARLPERVANLILDGVPLFDAALAAQLVQRYGTDITPRHGGGHLLAAWDAMRASTMWFPWYQRERANRLDFAIATAPQIDRFAIDLLKAGRGYDAIFKAVFGNDTAARLPAVTARTLVATAPEDLCLDFTRRAVSLLPHGSAAGVAPNPREHGEYYAAFSLGREAAAVYIEFLDGR